MSQELLELIERAIAPANITADLQRRSTAGRREVCCPSCGDALRMTVTGFWCPRANCSFKAGSVLDALTVLHPSYLSALDYLITKFRSRLEFLDTLDLEEVRPAIVSAARARRALYEFFLRRLISPPESNALRVPVATWLESRGISHSNNGGAAFVLTVPELEELGRLGEALNARGSILSHPCAAFPMMRNHHTVADVLFHCPKDKASRLTCIPSKFSFSGLIGADPAGKMELCYNYIEAAALSTMYSVGHPNTSIHSLGYNPTAGNAHWLPPKVGYLYSPDWPDLSAPGALFNDCPHLTARVWGGNPREEEAWLPFILDAVTRSLLRSGLDEHTTEFFFTAGLGTPEYARVIQAMHAAGRLDLAQAIERRISSYPVYQDDGVRLYSLPSGFFFANRSELRQAITNFTVKLRTNLSFLSSQDVFHMGELTLGETVYPLALPSGGLDHSKEFENAVRAAEARRPGGGVLPAVIDRPALKYVLQYLRGAVPRLKRQVGTAMLGWDSRRQTFFGPNWRVNADGFVSEPTTFHPDIEVLKFFSPTPELTAGAGEISATVCDIIAQALAMTARSYIGSSYSPVKIQNTEESREILSGLFRGLGQTSPLFMSFNSRSWGAVKGLEGFPIYTQGNPPPQMEKASLPAFVLADDGAQLTGPLGAGPDVLKSTLLKVVAWLIEHRGRGFRRKTSVSADIEMLKEGRELLLDVCGLADWPGAPVRYRVLEGLLQSIPMDKVGEYFAYNLGAQLVFLDLAKLRGVDTTSLELELFEMTKELKHAGGHLALDAFSAFEILHNFYGDKAYPKPIDWIPGEKVEDVVPVEETAPAAADTAPGKFSYYLRAKFS